MVKGWGTDGLDTRRSEQYGEKIEALEKQLGETSSLLQSVVDVVGRQQREGGESSVSVAAPRGTGPEAGTHHTDATGGTCLLYTSPSPRDQRGSRIPSSA